MPNPVLLRQLTELRIVNKGVGEKNKVVAPQNFVQKEETYAARNANGTGPFMLKSREVGHQDRVRSQSELVGSKDQEGQRHRGRLHADQIGRDAHRGAAIGRNRLSARSRPQDIARLKQTPSIKVIEGAENRTIFIGMDQLRDELQYSDVKGKNPFKDYARSAGAVSRDRYRGDQESGDARARRIRPASIIQRAVHGWTPARTSGLPYDEKKAKELLTAAGYPNGFAVTLDCPNNRYINDEEICKALVSMWAKIGLKVALNAMPRATYFPEDSEARHVALSARLGCADVRRAVLAAITADDGRQGRRRQLQSRTRQQCRVRQARRSDQGRGRRQEAQSDDRRRVDAA